MIPKLRHGWQETRDSFWFVPALIVLGAVGLATLLIALDARNELHFERQWPLVFGAGASGSRSLLTAVASSMITVAGVIFSITIVALSLASSQYTSRVLGNFVRDRMNQAVLGVFVGIFAYCLVVLRTIRGGDEGEFVPSLAVLGGLTLAFVGIAFLIYFIHHVSISIQASIIIAAVARETIAVVDRLFPEELGDGDADDAGSPPALEERDWSVVAAREMGYIESVDGEGLLAIAKEHGLLVRMERGIGEFVSEGCPLVAVASAQRPDPDLVARLNGVFVVSRHRTMHQDVGFGIRQLVDIGMKALSPGVNDTTTAVICVDYLGAILARLAVRGMEPPHCHEEGRLRVIARGPSFESLLKEAFDPLRQNASGNVAVLTRLLQALETIAYRTTDARRRQALRQQAGAIAAVAESTIPFGHDGTACKTASARLSEVLEGGLRRGGGA